MLKLKIFIICSKHFYHKVSKISDALKLLGHETKLPNSFDAPFEEERIKKEEPIAHSSWKANMIKLQDEKVKWSDAVLCINLEKKGQKNYIGGATFLEIFKAWELNKKIFLYNNIPKNIFEDELKAFKPIVINKDLSKIK